MTSARKSQPTKAAAQQPARSEGTVAQAPVVEAVTKGAAPTYESTGIRLDDEGFIVAQPAPMPQFRQAALSGAEPVVPEGMEDIVGELPEPTALPEGIRAAMGKTRAEPIMLGGGKAGGASARSQSR